MKMNTDHKLASYTKSNGGVRGTRIERSISGTALVTELKQCGNRKDLQGGKLLHACAIQTGCDKNRYVATALIIMYAKCRCMQDAQDVFDNVVQHDVISWTALISGYVENGDSRVALNVFNSMDCTPDRYTYVAALKACAGLATEKRLVKNNCLQEVVNIHNKGKERGFDRHIFVASALVDTYSKCGDMVKSRAVFDKMVQRDVVTWTALILGYVENGEHSVALDVFNSMDCAANRVTFVAALKACAGLAAESKLDKKNCLHKGERVHMQARECGFDKDVFVASTLVDMYSKCGDMLQSRDVFNEIKQPDAISWNALLLGYVENGESSVALDLFDSMECIPDGFTLVAALKACAGLVSDNKLDKQSCLQRGVTIHRKVSELGFEKDMFVAGALIEMYGRCGNMLQTRDVFDRMVQRDVLSWNGLILGYVENAECLVALDVYNSMDCAPDRFTFVAALKGCTGLATNEKLDKETCFQKGVAIHEQARERGYDKDVFVSNILVDMYSKFGNMVRAHEVFNTMTQRSTVSWTTLILGYVENGESSVALSVFNSMDCAPDSVTFVAALKACACLGALEAGQKIHDQVCDLGLEQDETVANCLVDFYGKCGNMAAAEGVFNRMLSRDIVSWTALIGGYSLLGDTSQVFHLVKRMQETGLQMDSVTMLLVLTACRHAGMVEEGLSYFDSMSRFGVTPTVEHYTCMVDMLGRANRLQEAFSLVRSMPFKADSHVWMALLGACKKWSHLEMAKVAFSALVALGNKEDVSAAYVLMQSIYERLGMQQEGEQMEAEKKRVGV